MSFSYFVQRIVPCRPLYEIAGHSADTEAVTRL
jgi:hypothetical protein